MRELLGDYIAAIESAEALIDTHGIDRQDLASCDTICYRVETNDRYTIMKEALARGALLLDESEVSGRLISVFELNHRLAAAGWGGVSYIELPQPKSGSDYTEGIDHLQFVTRSGLTRFQQKYAHLPFETKGLANQLNPLLKLSGDTVAVKFHDKHMGAVIELEHRIKSQSESSSVDA